MKTTELETTVKALNDEFRISLAVERYGKAVENMTYSNYDGDRKEVN